MAVSSTILFTGFPGFLGRELLPRVLGRDAAVRAVCLVQPKFMIAAAKARADLVAARPRLDGRIDLVPGDITAPRLGLPDPAALARTTRGIFHLAAVYDLSVGRALAMKVNVEGTREVLDFAAACPRLERFDYVSTCYVSGRHTGIFEERDLERGQRFNNFYEETKHLAEADVRRRMAEGLPAAIYRPSIVVGDSATGVTQKLDGPYHLLRWLLRQPRKAVMPVIGDPSRFRLNVVPRDFVVDAIAHLSARGDTLGRTWHLADPEPATCDEVLDLCARAAERDVVRVPLPAVVAKAAIDRVPGIYRLMQIPSTLIDYMIHPTHYATRDTQAALAPAGLTPPRFAAYVDALARFVRGHLQLGSAAMV